MKTKRLFACGLSLACVLLLAALRQKDSVIWKLNSLSSIGNHQPQVMGHPVVVQDGARKAIKFNGVDDGLILPINPLEGQKSFTIQVLFKPDAEGPPAPRFVHLQDSLDNRCTLELRVIPGGRWYADTFLRNGRSAKGVTLIDSSLRHPCNQWYWLALVYDGSNMSDYVNGVKEHEGAIALEPMKQGKISLGVRLNKVNWFKGQIAEIRFQPVALKREDLQRL